ncbi:MAG TPA: GYF domain-containing protein [Candidatus Didemnitutus sp.]|nr:GYF domain-containing protein [Candidatus Didemnitutus sp.]
MRYYYTDAANQPVGPCELEQLQALAAEGKITDATSVIPEGAQVWTTYGAVKPGAIPAPPPAPRKPVDAFKIATILGDTVGGLLGLLARLLTPALLKKTLIFCQRFGHFAVLAGATLGLVAALVASIQNHTMSSFAKEGVVFVIAVAVAQYSAQRFLNAADTLIAASPTRLASKSFLDCVGLFAALGALGALAGGIYVSIQADQLYPAITGLVIGTFLTFLALIALNPGEANVALEGGASAGEEAIAVFSFFSKAWLRLVPLVFFTLTALGVIGIIFSFSDNGRIMADNLMTSLGLPVGAIPMAGTSAGTAVVLLGCLVPVLFYLGFLISYLIIDLLRAQLSIPGKLDALKKS